MITKLVDCAELLGPDVHIQSDYGDEIGGRTPWELFDESDAATALGLAEDAVEAMDEMIAVGQSEAEESKD